MTDPQGGPSLLDAIESGQISLDDALTHYRPPTGGERAQTFGAILARAARDAYLSGTSAELRLAERGLAMLGADDAAQWMRGFADYVAPGGGFADDVGNATGLSLDVPEAAANEQSAVARAFTQLLPEGLGSTAGILALPGFGGAAGVALKGGLVGGGQQWVEAKAEGADDDTAWAAFAGGAGLGATDAIPIGRLLGRADAASGGALQRILWEGLVKGGAEEATQETLQTIGENLLAGALYDEDRAVIENVLESGQAGALTGMLLGAVVGAAGGRAVRSGQQGVRDGQQVSETVSAQPGQPIAAPDPDTAALAADLGAASLEEAPDAIKRYVEARGGRVAVGRGEGGARLRRPAATKGGSIVLDAQDATEAFTDHEVAHLAFEQDPEGVEAAKAAIEALAPGLHAQAQEDYVQDVLAGRRRAEGRDITPEEEAEIRSATPPDEAFARVNEDLSGVVRLLRRNPEAFAKLDNPSALRRVFRAVVDFGRKIAGRQIPDRERKALREAWKSINGPDTIAPEVGVKVAEVLRDYLDGMVGRPQRPGFVEQPASTAVQTPSTPEIQENGQVGGQVADTPPATAPVGSIPEPGPAPAPGRTDTYVGRRLLSFTGAQLDAAIADRLAREDAALREAFPGRGDAWYARAADLRRQARDPRNPEGDRAALALRRAGIQPLPPDPGGYSTEAYMDARAQQRTGKPDSSKVDQGPRYAAQRRRDQTNTPEFRAWFGDSKVVDGEGKPLVVYHGTKRPDRIGSRFRPERATSGPMAFFTGDPDIASNYATSKQDTSLDAPADYGEWFRYKPKGMRTTVDIDRAWHFLPAEERDKIGRNLPHVTYENAEMGEGPFVLGGEDDYGLSGKDHWDWNIRQARGNVLKAAKEIWLNGGSLFREEEGFMDILRAAGMDMSRTTFESPHAEFPGVIPVYLSIQRPLVAAKITPDEIAQLDAASRRTRQRVEEHGADIWDKRSRTPSVWMDELRSERPEHAWTSIPDWVTRELRRMGYDGIHDTGGKMGGEKHDVWIPFEPTQIKSATGNRGTFDPRNPDIRYAAQRRPDIPAMHAAIQAAPDEELERIIRTTESDPDSAARRILAVYERARRSGDTATMNLIREQLGGQERYAVWRRAMPSHGQHTMTWDVRDRLLAYAVDAWRAPGRWRDALATAGKVTDANDIVLQENLRRSGTLKVVQDETASHVVPLRELLAGGPVSLDDAGRYLLARAAPDRNKLIAGRGGPANGSGMSDADAAKIVNAAQTGPHAQRYADIAAAFDRLTARKLDLMEQYGLLSAEQVAELRAQEPLYAPMKRDPQAERLYGEEERPTVGIGRTRRKEFRAATGRSTEAENPIVYATMDLMAAIERGMWNATTGRATLEMAREFSDPKIAVVDVPATQRTVRDGKVVETPALERENEVVVKENGVSRVVRFGKGWEPVAAAIKGGDRGATDALLAALRPATRLLAGLSTRWNPAFQPVNAVRDALGAYLNASADLGPRAAAAMVNPRSVLAAMRDLRANGPWATRFANAGGPVAFLDLARTFEEEAKRTIRAIEKARPANGPWEMPRRYAAQVAGLLERMGQISENATRLAAFKYAVEELGASDARAAQYAKNLTTNFERRGSNAWMSALYAFSNAGVQGTARVGQALRTPWGQRAAAALVAGSFLLSYLNRITGGEDEDGVPRWDKIPEWQRRSNAIFMAGDTKLMVPMPFVWNIFHALGTEIERGAFGGQTPMESTQAVGSALAGALNPLGGESDLIDTLTPTLLDPAMQVARNRDYAGRAIFPDARSRQMPDSELAWDSTSPTLQTLASGLNSMSGGDAGTPGLVDVSPATLEFLTKQYLGGVGGEASRVLRLAEKLIRGEDVESQDVPVVRRFVGSLGLSEQRAYFKERRGLIERQVLREKAGEPYDSNLWRLRKRANRWDERISELEKAARGASGPERDRIRSQLREVFLEATAEIEEATK